MEGPQFSTRAESNMYRSWGGSVINMSALPEAKLAREDVDVAMVMGHMAANGGNARRLVGAVLDELIKDEHKDLVIGTHWVGATTGMIQFMTKAEGRGAEGVKNVEYLFPGVFSS